MRLSIVACLVAITGFPFAAATAHAATASTAQGHISVAQVMAMLDQAESNSTAAQVLQAYLGGVGESTGVLVNATDQQGRLYVTCERALSFDVASTRKALEDAVPDKSAWAETAATPVLVSALVTRARCR
ncbi:MAG: chlorophyllide reductase [Devosia sp.]